MKRTNENIVSSFFFYMWNGWGAQEECRQVFGYLSDHFWEKWNSLFQRYHGGAAERFYAELSEDNRRLLVERACQLYDGNRDLPRKAEKIELPDESAETSEKLRYIADQLKLNHDEWDLTNDEGKASVFDAEKEVYIPDIMLSKDNTPCAIIPLGYFEDDTIQAIVDIVSL